MMNFGEVRESEAEKKQKDNKIKDDEFMLFLAEEESVFGLIY